MSRGERIKQFLRALNGSDRISGMEVNCMPPTGDCFYCAVEEAMSNARAFSPVFETIFSPDVSFLRHIVSDSLTNAIFETYLLYYESGIEGIVLFFFIFFLYFLFF